MSYTVTAGTGFRFRNLRFLGGQGGLDLKGGTDIRGEYVYGTEQRDTENGWSGVLHVGNSRNVHVQHVYGVASDRGIEIDDGPTDVTIEKIWIEDIAPTMDTYSFTLDVHRHGDAADTDNVTFRDAALVSCQKGLTASNHSPAGSLSNVTFENVVQVDCGTPRVGADDATLRNVHIYADEQEPGNALAHSGGRLRVDGFTVHYAPDTYLQIAGGDRIPHRECVIDGLYGEPADGTAGNAIRVGSGTELEGLTVRNVTIDPDLDAFARLESGATTDDGWGGTFRDCRAEAEQSYVVDAENGPITVTGGSAASSMDISPVGSRFDAVAGVSPESVDSGVIVDGVATNDGDPTDGDGLWSDNDAILRANGAIIWDTTTDPHTPYAVDGDGNWLQWGGTTDGSSGGGFFDIF
jgi:hypothetical protein